MSELLFPPEADGHRLALFVDFALPMKINDYELKGGPDEEDHARIQGRESPYPDEDGIPTHRRYVIVGHVLRDGTVECRDEHVRSATDVLAEKGDVLQYGGKRGEAAKAFAVLVDALAVMSFCPGGVRFCGRRWLASSGFPYEVCVRCACRHAGDCPAAEETPPGVEAAMSHGRRIVARYRRADA